LRQRLALRGADSCAALCRLRVEAAITAPDPLTAAAWASAAAMKLCPPSTDAEIFAFVVADFALARRLDWARPVPLLAVAMAHPSLRRGAGGKRPRPAGDDWPDCVARAYGLAIVEAHALAVDLAGGRKSFSPSRRCCAQRARAALLTCCSPTTP
jgi:hypothetical protein